ncbi:uncharacterized protein OCT59_008544 [Rhizophagus irregularis]|uniref:uncharacterized protein n=1 Tax=Rhizophagus irregularis TaxID=588596 RepID=UPI00331806FA|nr:hypothetical protein OCT59_008544 [Rhizophagus irregularis]
MAPRPVYGIPLDIFRIYLSLENLLAHEHLQTVYCVLCVYLVSKLWVMIKKLIVKADENTRKYLAQYEASMHDTELAFFRERAAARERERQREGEERANRRAKAEKERERSHGRENRERERERERERVRDRDRDRQYRHYHQQRGTTQTTEVKRKTEMEIAFKWRERRWQHREETMATNREREAERD